MFVVPDTVDMTKVCTWRGLGVIGKWGPESWKSLKDYPAHISDYINE